MEGRILICLVEAHCLTLGSRVVPSVSSRSAVSGSGPRSAPIPSSLTSLAVSRTACRSRRPHALHRCRGVGIRSGRRLRAGHEALRERRRSRPRRGGSALPVPSRTRPGPSICRRSRPVDSRGRPRKRRDNGLAPGNIVRELRLNTADSCITSGRDKGEPVAEKTSWIQGIPDNHLKKLLSRHAAANPTSGSFMRGAPGAPGFIFMRPPCRPGNCPDWPRPPDVPCGGDTWVWQPDLAAQLIHPPDCPSQSDLDNIKQGLTAHLTAFQFANPDVRVSCAAGTISVLIWSATVDAGSCDDLARQRAAVPADIAAGGDFGVFVNSSLIRSLAQKAFDAAPKTLDETGAASASGPIHLTGLSVQFPGPNVVQTIIGGYDERPWPDVSFTLTITDTLQPNRFSTTTSNVNANTSDEVLAGLLASVLAVFSIVIPALIPLAAFALFKDLDAEFNQPNNPQQGGAGASVMQGLPSEIALPGTGGILPGVPPKMLARTTIVNEGVQRTKIVIPYNQPRVDDRGILVSAIIAIQPRTPSVTIVGPDKVTIVGEAAETYGVYRVQAEDFYGNLSFSWGGDGVVWAPNASATTIAFGRGSLEPGEAIQQQITVRVTDSDGSSATATLVVGVLT